MKTKLLYNETKWLNNETKSLNNEWQAIQKYTNLWIIWVKLQKKILKKLSNDKTLLNVIIKNVYKITKNETKSLKKNTKL